MIESTEKNSKRLYFFHLAFCGNVFKSSCHFPSSASVCKCCDSSTEIHAFFPTIIIICYPLLRLAITSACVGHVGAWKLNVYFGPG